MARAAQGNHRLDQPGGHANRPGLSRRCGRDVALVATEICECPGTMLDAWARWRCVVRPGSVETKSRDANVQRGLYRFRLGQDLVAAGTRARFLLAERFDDPRVAGATALRAPAARYLQAPRIYTCGRDFGGWIDALAVH